MKARVRDRATYADLERVPETLVAELIDGELFTSPRPRRRHARASSRLGARLAHPYEFGEGGPGGWIFYDEPELHLGPVPDEIVLIPDLAGWRAERLSEMSDDDHRFRVVPDWICEVTSPSTGGLDRIRKMPLYAQHGVGHAWLIDPEWRSLEVCRLNGQVWTTVAVYSGEQRVHAEPFDAIELNLAELWGS